MVLLRKIASFLSLALLCTLTGGCIDHAYDSNRVSRDIAVGGSDLLLPLGSTRQFTVAELIGERFENLFQLQEDDSYNASYDADPVDFLFAGLKDYDGSRPFSKYTYYPISTSFYLFTKPSDMYFNALGVADLSSLLPAEVPIAPRSKGQAVTFSRMPDQLLGLESITMTPNSRIKVTIAIPNCILTEGTVTATVHVNMSQFFHSEQAKDGIVTIVAPLSQKNNYSYTTYINLNKLLFDPDDYDAATHTLTMNAVLGFSGSVGVSGAKTTRARYQSAPKTNELEVTAELVGLSCASIVGCYDYTISSLQTRVDLKEMTDEVSNLFGDAEDTVFDFADPEILLNVESNISVPTYAVINLTAMKNRKKVAEMKGISVPLPIAEPGGSLTQQIRLGKTAHGPDDIVLDFSSLIQALPDEIVVDITGYTYKDRFGEVRVGQSYLAHVTPHVNLPLSLGPEMVLTFRDTLDFPVSLDSLLRANPLALHGKVTNTIPAKLDLELTAFSSTGEPLLEPSECSIAADGLSNVSLPMVLRKDAGIDSLSVALLTFRVKGTQNSRPVRSTDYVSADLGIQMTGGYHLSF